MLFEEDPPGGSGRLLVGAQQALALPSGEPAGPSGPPAATTVSQWAVAVTVEVTPAPGAGAGVHIRAVALTGLAVQLPRGGGTASGTQHYAAAGAEVELREVFATPPSPTTLSCLSRLAAVRARLAALNARLQAERAQFAAACNLAEPRDPPAQRSAPAALESGRAYQPAPCDPDAGGARRSR